jgi:hypothetical protein
MKQIRLGYHLTIDATALSDADVAKLVILLSKVKAVNPTGDNVEGEWVSALYHIEDTMVQLSRSDEVVFPNYQAAKAHIDALKAAAEEGRITRLA